eukprot:6525533-Pyramimonas_sp.AAC.1
MSSPPKPAEKEVSVGLRLNTAATETHETYGPALTSASRRWIHTCELPCVWLVPLQECKSESYRCMNHRTASQATGHNLIDFEILIIPKVIAYVSSAYSQGVSMCNFHWFVDRRRPDLSRSYVELRRLTTMTDNEKVRALLSQEASKTLEKLRNPFGQSSSKGDRSPVVTEMFREAPACHVIDLHIRCSAKASYAITASHHATVTMYRRAPTGAGG